MGACLESRTSRATDVAQAVAGQGRVRCEAGLVRGLGGCWVMEGPASHCEVLGATVLRKDFRGPGRGLLEECRP